MLIKQEQETSTETSAPSPERSKRTPGRIGLPAILLGLALLIAPSGWFAWKFRSMPQLGSYHDDAILLLSGRSLALDHGYRIPHLPENPAQTKYPPLYPALLSLFWRVAGAFPQNLAALTALQWSFYPLYAGLVWLWFSKCGFSPPAAFGLAVIPALCPITILLGMSPLTEIPFCVVLLSLMMLLETKDEAFGRGLSPTRFGLLAGVLAGVAFLIRTNSLVLALSVPVLLLLERRTRTAIAFFVPLAATIVGWQAWCHWNGWKAMDDSLSYYTSYAGFYVRTFSWADFPHRIWVNFAAVIESLGRLVIFSVDNTFAIRVLGWLLSAIAISGVVALYRKGIRHYPVFGLLLIGILVLWQYPPDTRFVYPLFPLYVAGLATKLQEVGKLAMETWRQKRGADRVAVIVTFAFIFAIAAGSLTTNLKGDVSVLPGYFADAENQRAEMQPVYRWIESHTGPTDRFAAYDDPLLYLNAGRQGYTTPLLPGLVYGQDSSDVQRYIQGLGAFWSEKHVAYVLVTKYDYRRDLHDVALDTLHTMVEDRARFEPVYSDPAAQVYRYAEGGVR
jgi:hypothetical protein